ncbi:MAG TPA: hypothetical protein VF140_04180 [Phycicoccus sp.]
MKYLTKASAPWGVFSRAAAGIDQVSLGDGVADAEVLGEGDAGLALTELLGVAGGSDADSHPEPDTATPTSIAATPIARAPVIRPP